ncbi:hypothetical protein Pse7367_3481 [Thalassoporum mexicanum PCC 7367]|uniref:PD-(D/E)XK nuclease family protein n=1 Tax=Thalassoporum mexicanum TaxID=3457544 RepID=UPI00029FF8A7|nr:PD-(D/E)XK nuclease family protein [Pseudanabaena sp. PCC 7367]AFY71717.1 hypothetical protein Pse7367_3481 [Pseudanabaena sp. PCC 7367]
MQEDLAIAPDPFTTKVDADPVRHQSAPIAIAQSHLSKWQTCRRKFQHTYIDSLTTPISSIQEEKMQLGQKFHLLMQQHALGLDVEPLVVNYQDRKLQKWLDCSQEWLAQLQQSIGGDRHSEHRRTLSMPGSMSGSMSESMPGSELDNILAQRPERDKAAQVYTLTAVYDLVFFADSSALIVDWKTHQKPIPTSQLRASWQTRLYLFLLAETTAYQPDQLKITYWFANKAKATTLGYDAEQHERTRADLKEILAAIDQAKQTNDFPKIELTSSAVEVCKHCDFAYRCDRDALIEADASNKNNELVELLTSRSPQISDLPTELIKHPEQLATSLEQIPEIEI